ncbi:M48 family metallopeptidase [Pectinatus frisingensis]|uniref:M48 family metallopeptidase n=1 Tax=Pectinatus frisingensis TaxID=865 RepID=UPI0018C7BE81|nr:SprT family zinc-dependent metalloprotease [Pectinatus frisingensis]
MPHIQIGDTLFEYIQKRQKRKTISIALNDRDSILIKTPYNVSAKEVSHILHHHSNWLNKKNHAYKALADNAPINDNHITYKGKNYNIHLQYGSTVSIKLTDDNVFITYNDTLFPLLSDILIPWYKQQAQVYLTQRTNFWASQLNVFANRITIRDQKSRWGSCSSRRNINYNWRIMMAAPTIIDYLVIHETSHLIQMNHSDKFWHLVETYDPFFKEHRLWLKENGTILFNTLRN